jgi:hypothetical protein
VQRIFGRETAAYVMKKIKIEIIGQRMSAHALT